MDIHIIQYKGYNVYYESPLYRIGKFPLKSFISFEEARKEIDRVEEALQNNLNELMGLVKKNQPYG